MKTLICAGIVFAGFTASEVKAYDISNARNALQLINHVNSTVSEITQSRDPIVLEREYNALTVDYLKLDSIGDQETIDVIKNLLATAKKLRITAVEREMLQEEINQELEDAIYSSMPNIGSLASPNILSTAVNLTIGAASAYVNYEKQKKAIMRRAKRSEWNLKKDDIETLDSMNQQLLECHWRIIRRYNIDDYTRVTAKQIADMIEHFKDPDKKRRQEFFTLYEKQYRTFTRYWYYRAVASSEVGDKKDMRKSLDEFQRRYYQIVRNDKIAALVAMMKVQLLLEESTWYTSNREIIRQLEIIEHNATKDDWNLFYFCGLVYADKLSDWSAARRVLKKAVNELSFKQESRLSEFRGNLSSGSEKPNISDIPSADALMICRTKLQLIEEQKGNGDIHKDLLDVISKENSFILDSFYYIGRTKREEVVAKLLPYIVSSRLHIKIHWGRKDSCYIWLPVEWFQTAKLTPSLAFGDTAEKMTKVLYEDESERELGVIDVDPFYSRTLLQFYSRTRNGFIWGRFADKDFKNEKESVEAIKEIFKDGACVGLRFRVEIDTLHKEYSVAILIMPHKYCTVKIMFKLPKNSEGENSDGIGHPIKFIVDGAEFSLCDSK